MKIKTTKHYDRAERKYAKKRYPIEDLGDCVSAIIGNDKKFLIRHKDHSIGPIREMHINRQYNDDWLWFYRKDNNQLELLLIDLGNHTSINRIVSQWI